MNYVAGLSPVLAVGLTEAPSLVHPELAAINKKFSTKIIYHNNLLCVNYKFHIYANFMRHHTSAGDAGSKAPGERPSPAGTFSRRLAGLRKSCSGRFSGKKVQ
jgi:hypothetical protein